MAHTLNPAWVIELPDQAPPPARMAADELRTTLTRLGGPDLPILPTAPGQRIKLSYGPDGDGFLRAPDADGLHLAGDGPRGLLYAVYDLLEALGCHWPAPAAASVPPAQPAIQLPLVAVADRPALPIRGLILGHDHMLAQAEAWINWAAHNRLNTIFVHTTIHEPALGACRLSSWRKRRRALLPLIRSYGLRLELGGHHLRDLLPRRLFRHDPTLFRHNGAYRTPDHNLCVSNPQALAWLRRSATAFFAAYPEAEVYHLWPDDLRSGGWCYCPACAHLGPAEQALIAANTLAAALPIDRPTARVSYLAYHDTETAPTITRPHPQLNLLFAPRLRSYAESLAGPANASVAAALTGCVTTFGTRPEPTVGPQAGLAAFEYYLDGLLFKSSPPPLADVIAADLVHYHRTCIGAVYALLTGDRPFNWAPPNAYCFARLAWAPTSDPQQILAAYAAARCPAAPARLICAYEELALAWRPALARDPRRITGSGWHQPSDPVSLPPTDVLDPIDELPLELQRRLEAMRLAEGHLALGQVAWASLETYVAGDPDLAAEHAEWELSAALLHFFYARQQLYVLEARDAAPTLLSEALASAQAALDTLLTWASHHVPPQARAGHLLLRAVFQLQLDHLADRYLLTPWGRLGLRARRAGDLLRLLPHLLR